MALKELIGKYIKQTDRILNVGCGNSRLSEEMHDDGYKQLVNIDFSPICVSAMKEKYKGREGLTCRKD
jgi:2-polyprenyl-3-methyl-5-hydroxy-6-metoxy-1,4-benzoquinol methylase